MSELVELVHRVFQEKGRGEVEAPPKRGIVPKPGATIRAMKAFIPSMGAAGVKWISAYPQNADRNLPSIYGLVALNDIETGIPFAVMDCTLITGMRTAAATVVAARYLARPESSSVGLIACGLQGRMNLRALAENFKLSKATVYDIMPDNAKKFAVEMSDELGIEIKTVKKPHDAVKGVDILVSSAPVEKEPDPPIPAGLLDEGAFACLLDFDSSFRGEAMREADRFVTDDISQVNFFRRIGYLRETPEPDGDLGKIVAGRQSGRRSDSERTVSMNMGIGLLDVATASLLYEKAFTMGLGTSLPL